MGGGLDYITMSPLLILFKALMSLRCRSNILSTFHEYVSSVQDYMYVCILCRDPRLVLGIFSCSSSLFFEVESLSQTQSLLIWLVSLDLSLQTGIAGEPHSAFTQVLEVQAPVRFCVASALALELAGDSRTDVCVCICEVS